MKANNPYLKMRKGKNTPKKPLNHQETEPMMNSDEKLQQRSNRFTMSIIPTMAEDEKPPLNEIFVPSCLEMCPLSECIEREKCLDVHPLEADDDGGKLSYESIASNVHRRINPRKAVKKYRRPAAGAPPPKPSEVRTPKVILRTLEYLMSSDALGRSDVPLTVRSAFVRDRGRALRADLSRQVKQGREGVLLNLAMARFHALIAHELCEEDRSEFDPFQNSEQLSKTLTTLNEFTPLMTKSELSEFRAMKIVIQIDDLSFTSTTNLSGAEAWALSLLIAYRTKDAAGYIRRSMVGPLNCSQSTSLVLCSFAHFHLHSMRMLLVEQMQSSLSVPIPQTLPIKSLLLPFGFADDKEAVSFFSQLSSYSSIDGSFKFCRDFQCPESILLTKSKLLVTNRLSNIVPGDYNKALCQSITLDPVIDFFYIEKFTTSFPVDEHMTIVENVADAVFDKFAHNVGANTVALDKSDKQTTDLSLLKSQSSIETKMNSSSIDPDLCSRIVTNLIGDSISSILRPFILSAIRKRNFIIRQNLSSCILSESINSVVMEVIIAYVKNVLLMKKVTRRWRGFVQKKDLASQLLPLLPETIANTSSDRILPMLTDGNGVNFYNFLFKKCQFTTKLFLDVNLLDWSNRPTIPKCSYIGDVTARTYYKCKNLISQWKQTHATAVKKNQLTLMIVAVDTMANYDSICKHLKAIRSKIIRDQIDLLFVAFLVHNESLIYRIDREATAKRLCLSPFNVNVFYGKETTEIDIVDWLRPSLSLLLLPGGVAWIESEILFRENLNENIIDAVIDSDFIAYLSESENPTLEAWRSSEWYRRYVVVLVSKMQTWEKNLQI